MSYDRSSILNGGRVSRIPGPFRTNASTFILSDYFQNKTVGEVVQVPSVATTAPAAYFCFCCCYAPVVRPQKCAEANVLTRLTCFEGAFFKKKSSVHKCMHYLSSCTHHIGGMSPTQTSEVTGDS